MICDHHFNLRGILSLLFAWAVLSNASAQTKGPALADRSLSNGTVFAEYADAAVFLRGLINAESDLYGLVSIDFGSASGGRGSFRLGDVVLSMEERPEEPGCQDVCPPRVIVSVQCTRGPCTWDPALDGSKHESCSFTLVDMAKGRQVYEVLMIMQRFLRTG